MCSGLEKAYTGSSLYVYKNEEEKERYIKLLNEDVKRVKTKIKLKKEGVGVAASTLGSLEALLVYLKKNRIPVSSITIGDVSKTDI